MYNRTMITQNDIIDIIFLWALWALIGICVCVIVGYIIYRILRNPFQYPYFNRTFDVSRKRNVDIIDYVDRYLCDGANWINLKNYEKDIEQWKHDTKEYLKTCRLKKRRTKQYYQILDDEHTFRFRTVRGQTRYRQQNYVKTAYKVSVSDSEMSVDWAWLVDRHKKLEDIGFEATLKEYSSKNQRKLMTKALRKEIMERDRYTCCICGKYMPDEVGLHIDHIIPVSKGGKTVSSNLQVLCSKCNGSKSAKL